MMKFGKAFQVAGMIVLVATCASWAARPPLSDIVSIEDVEEEIKVQLAEIELALVSPEQFQASKGRLRLAAGQLAVFSQVLAEHTGNAELKSASPAIRDAAIQIGRSNSFDEAQTDLQRLNVAISGKAKPPMPVEFDWSKLARVRLLMDVLRERSDQVRKALRRSKDALAESRQASAMAMIALAVAAGVPHANDPRDAEAWTDWSLEFQRNMTQTASALRRQDRVSALEHFTAAQSACTKCHDRFKP